MIIEMIQEWFKELLIDGIILTFVMCYELIQLIVEKNNLHCKQQE